MRQLGSLLLAELLTRQVRCLARRRIPVRHVTSRRVLPCRLGIRCQELIVIELSFFVMKPGAQTIDFILVGATGIRRVPIFPKTTVG